MNLNEHTMNLSTCSLLLLMCSSVLHCATDESCAGRKRMQVVCFFALWYRDFNSVRAKDIDPYLCNQMVFAYALCGLEASTNTWTIRHIANDPDGDLLRSIIERNRPSNIPNLISVGGNNDFTYPDATIGKGKYRSIATNQSSQKSFLEKVTEFLQEYNLDGVDFFWNWIGRNSEKYTDLEDLSSITKALCSHMKRNGFLCSVTLRLFLWEDGFTEERIYEIIRQIVRAADVVHIWTADIAAPSLIPDDMLLSINASSHLYYKYSVNYIVDFFKTALQNNYELYEKLSLVIPLQWNSKGISAGKEPVFGQAPLRSHPIDDPIRSQYPYYRVCERLRHQIRGEELNVTMLDNEFPTAYSLKFGRSDKGLAVPYLTENVAKQKVQYALKENLGAVSVFQIGADDVHGWCDNQSYPILNTIRNAVDNCELYYKETT